MKYINEYDEEVVISHSQYNILTTDNNEVYDKIINPFDLNITKNNPYNNEEKNKSCFLNIETEFEKILVIFKTSELPSFDEMYELYYNYHTDTYDIEYNLSLINDNELVMMYGTSIIVLDYNDFKVRKFISSDNINEYGINIILKDDMFVVEDIKHNFVYFDKELREIN